MKEKLENCKIIFIVLVLSNMLVIYYNILGETEIVGFIAMINSLIYAAAMFYLTSKEEVKQDETKPN